MQNAESVVLSTDQVAALVELARLGSLRDAARELKITEYWFALVAGKLHTR